MKILPLIIILLLFCISCSNSKSDLTILDGEWITDSLNTKNSDNWKEFIYFKNGKLLAHTTWWGKNYILNENQTIINNQFHDNQNNSYKIEVIDSSQIKIIGKDYYAKFIKDKNQPDNINSEILEFKISQRNKEKLIGKWKINNVQKIVADKEYEKEPVYLQLLKSTDFNKFLSFPSSKIDFIQIDDSDFTVFFKDKKEIKFNYIINSDSIDLYVGDVIYNVRYKLSENTMVYENYDKIGIITRIFFAR